VRTARRLNWVEPRESTSRPMWVRGFFRIRIVYRAKRCWAMVDPALFAELSKLCLRSFPERLDQRVSQIQAQPDHRHPMVTFQLSWRKGRQLRVERLVLRRYADAWTWWATADPGKAQREWTVMRWLYAEGLPVPRLYGVHAGDDDALLLAYVAGRSAATASKAGELRCVEALADTLAQLHGLTPPESVRQCLPSVSLSGQVVRLQDATWNSSPALQQAIRSLPTDVEELPPCVVHGDPQLANVLCDARGITALLDWENSALGDRRWDVVRVVNWLSQHAGPKQTDRFCAAYAAQAQVTLSDLDLWQAAVAAQQWAIAVRFAAYAERVTDWQEQCWRALTRWQAART